MSFKPALPRSSGRIADHGLEEIGEALRRIPDRGIVFDGEFVGFILVFAVIAADDQRLEDIAQGALEDRKSVV